MDNRYVILQPELSLQRNALRIEFIPPQARCALKPKNDAAVMLRSRWNWRTDQLERASDQFEDCTNACNCSTCPFARDETRRLEHRAPANIVIRKDPIRPEAWWLLPNAESGWDGYGYCYPSLRRLLNGWGIEIDEHRADKWGEYWTVAHYNQPIGGSRS